MDCIKNRAWHTELFSSTMAIISCIPIPIQQACNQSLASGQCIVTRERMHQLVAGQVLYRHDLLCSQFARQVILLPSQMREEVHRGLVIGPSYK